MLLRKFKNGWVNAILLGGIIAVAVCFFAIIQTIIIQYENASNAYFERNNLAHAELTAFFVNESAKETFQKEPGIAAVERRMVVETDTPEGNCLRLIVTEDDSRINIPHIYERGQEDKGCYISMKYARFNRINIGDTVTFKWQSRSYTIPVIGIFASPEYVYLAKSATVPMANQGEFGLILMDESSAEYWLTPRYNSLLLLYENNKVHFENAELRELGKEAMGDAFMGVTLKEDGISYANVEEDIRQMGIFAFLFPVVFFFIAALIIYVLLRREIDKDRRLIGIKQAIGLRYRDIFKEYAQYILVILGVSLFLSFTVGYIIGAAVLHVMGTGMFEVPGLKYAVIPRLWIIASLIALAISYIGILLSWYSSKVYRLTPADLLLDIAPHSKEMKAGTQKRYDMLEKLQLNTRYALKTALRSKGRFFAMVIGIMMGVALTVFSFGFQDGINSMVYTYYDEVTNYDLMVSLVPRTLDQTPEFVDSDKVESYAKAQVTPTTLTYKGREWELPLLGVDESFDMLNLIDEDGTRIKVAGGGVFLPAYIGEEMNIKKGDYINIKTVDDTYDFSTWVEGFVKQDAGFYIYINFGTLENLSGKDKGYNVLFLRTDYGDELVDELAGKPLIVEASTLENSRESMTGTLKTSSILISIVKLFAVLLGVISTLSVSMIGLMVRRYEFAVLKVLGYMTPQIMKAYIKELALQLIIAYPFGLLIGFAILDKVREQFSSDALCMPFIITPASYAFIFLMIIGIMVVVCTYVAKYIGKIDLVEAMKAKE